MDFRKKSACQQPDVYISKTETNESFGLQLCYWVNHDVKPWRQPIFSLAATNLNSFGIFTPGTLIKAAFHKANKNSSLTVFYYSNPEMSGISSPDKDWAASSWHPNNIKAFSENTGFVEDYLKWIKFWFPIFRSIQKN